jgi:regulatory protein
VTENETAEQGRWRPAAFPAARAEWPEDETSRGPRARRGKSAWRAAARTPGEPATDFDHGPEHDDGDGAPGDPAARARQVCLRLLRLSPRTRAQLADALRKRGIPDEAADEVLGRFEDVGLIDDAAFARAWVESRHHSRGLAGRALSAELKQRGVAADEIRAAIDEQLSPEAEAAAARVLVDRRLSATRGLPADQRIRRLAGLLARKGYPAGLAFRVIREALEAEGEAAALDDESPFDDPDDITS